MIFREVILVVNQNSLHTGGLRTPDISHGIVTNHITDFRLSGLDKGMSKNFRPGFLITQIGGYKIVGKPIIQAKSLDDFRQLRIIVGNDVVYITFLPALFKNGFGVFIKDVVFFSGIWYLK